ncbi:early nodulin-like protein 1 [Nicotiana sylvestris]|uniref:early nodulin-like protein 1 n=1 Tax=Nicotiana sylvestris TaxID=4096 RepID=UPI00388CC8C6
MTPRSSSILLNVDRRTESHGDYSKSKLPSPSGGGGDENGYGQLHEPYVDGKHSRSPSPSNRPCHLPHHAQPLEPSTTLQSSIEHESNVRSTLFSITGGNKNKPSILPLDTSTSTAPSPCGPSDGTRSKSGPGSAGSRRGGDPPPSEKKIYHRNLNHKRYSPYAIFGEGGQEIHTTLPSSTSKVLNRDNSIDQHCNSKVCSPSEPHSEGQPFHEGN